MSDTPSGTSTIKRIAFSLRWAGWIGFWVQIVLAVVSTLIFLFALPFAQPSSSISSINTPSIGGSIFFAVCGLLVLFFSVYQAFRYTRLAKQLQDANPNLRPKKADTMQILRFGLIVSLVGMLLTIMGAEAVTGTLLAKALAQGSGVSIVSEASINRLIQPLDIFLVLATTHTITAHFAGMVTSIWLLNRMNRQ